MFSTQEKILLAYSATLIVIAGGAALALHLKKFPSVEEQTERLRRDILRDMAKKDRAESTIPSNH